MTGKIIKGIAGFYYIHTPEHGVYECRAKGIFRNKKIKPLVGDNVEITVLDEENLKGNIIEIQKRKNQLIRPEVANIDQALVIFAAAEPDPNYNLLDRFLVMMARQEVEVILCFNKSDIVSEETINQMCAVYEDSGYHTFQISIKKEKGIEQVLDILKNKTTVMAGPSGVGKSSLINKIDPKANMEIGKVSDKIKRGKHTTRHSELFMLDEFTYIMDTPGFSSLYISDYDAKELKNYFPEFILLEDKCRFKGCVHVNEPGCEVKKALEEGRIHKVRYHNYLLLYQELCDQKRRY